MFSAAALANLFDDATASSIGLLERAMGVVQHHDGVSGTERQHVANDYAKRLSIGVTKCVDVISRAFSNILAAYTVNGNSGAPTNVQFCPLLNISECDPIERQSSFTVIVYNQLAREVDSWLRLPTFTDDYVVYEASSGRQVASAYAPVYEDTMRLPERHSQSNYTLLFSAHLPPLGFQVFSVHRTSRRSSMTRRTSPQTTTNVLENSFLRLTFDPTSGALTQVDNLESGVSSQLSQAFCYYHGQPGNNSEPEFQASGAYIFRPAEAVPTCLPLVSSQLSAPSDLFTELHQVFGDAETSNGGGEWVSQTVRLYNDSRHVEFEWQVGPIPVPQSAASDTGVGKEVIVVFKSELASSATFYTDANGREILKRVRDYRPTWNLSQTEPQAGNYYPVNSRIFVRDETDQQQQGRQLTLVTDRSHGGSSLADGQIELMLHRRLLCDDSLGVSEVSAVTSHLK